MIKISTIRIENLRYLNPMSCLDYNVIDADIYIDNKKYSGFCDIETFFLDSHLTINHNINLKNQSNLKSSKISYYFNNFTSIKESENILLEFNKKWRKIIAQTSILKKHSLRKKWLKARKKLKLNNNYLKEREYRNKIFNRNSYSLYFLNSCSCGVPSCNGYYDGIFIRKIKLNSFSFIKYTAPKNKGYEHSGILGTEKMDLILNYSDILEVRKQIKSFVKRNPPILIDNDQELDNE